jgi:Fission yeast centromere protein N-terminal domain/Tc5 transposase DNA-binding domain
MAESSTKKTRNAVTHEQRIAIRQFNKQTGGLRSGKEIAAWFEAQYHRPIHESIISRTLSSKFAHLDTSTTMPLQQTFKRRRTVEWPHVEEALFEWIRRVEKKTVVSGDMIKEKASFFWKSIYRESDDKEPK